MSGQMGDEPAAVSSNSLLCGESADFIGFLESGEISCPEWSSVNEYCGEEFEIEHLEELMRKEAGLGFEPRIPSGLGMDSSRSLAVDIIVNTSARFGFHYHTTYLSIAYIDRFLAARSVEMEKPWAVRLLSLASLSLAAKMEEAEVPALPDFCVQHYAFDSKCFKKMELLVLTTLDWRMTSATPYSYLRHFIRKIFGESFDMAKQLLSVAMELVLSLSKEINTLDFRPSVVAAAAVLASSGDELTKNVMATKTHLISSSVSLDNEHVYECYRLIQDIKLRRNTRTPTGEVITFSTPSKDPPCCNHPTNGSRKRLLYSETHQEDPTANKMLRGNSTPGDSTITNFPVRNP